MRDGALSVVAVVGSVCLVVALVCALFGFKALVFRSGSMAPSIETGALALARTVPAVELRPGDVVSVHAASGSRVTHRVVTSTPIGAGRVSLVLRGDANREPDAQTSPVSSAERVVFSVPVAGRVVAWLAGPWGMFLGGLYAATLLRVVFRRREPSVDEALPPTERAAPGARLHLLVPAAALATAVVVSPAPQATLAAWTDNVTTANSTVSTLVVGRPSQFDCGTLGIFSVNFTWTAVPGASGYTLHYGNGGSSTKNVPANATSTSVTSVLSGGTAWITAYMDFNGQRWTSVNSSTRSYTVAALSLCN